MATHSVCGELDADSSDSVETVAQRGIRGLNLLGNGFRTKHDDIVAKMTACATMITHWGCGEFDAESCDGVEKMTQEAIRDQSLLGYRFWTKYNVILGKATACATIATHWFFGKLNTASCDSVEMVAQQRIVSQNCLEIFFRKNIMSLLP